MQTWVIPSASNIKSVVKTSYQLFWPPHSYYPVFTTIALFYAGCFLSLPLIFLFFSSFFYFFIISVFLISSTQQHHTIVFCVETKKSFYFNFILTEKCCQECFLFLLCIKFHPVILMHDHKIYLFCSFSLFFTLSYSLTHLFSHSLVLCPLPVYEAFPSFYFSFILHFPLMCKFF